MTSGINTFLHLPCRHHFLVLGVFLCSCTPLLSGRAGLEKQGRTGNWRGANWEVVRPALQHPTSPEQASTAGQEIKALQALVKKQQRTVIAALAFAALMLLLAALWARKLRQREREQFKKQLEKELMQEHDYKTLRLLIVNAEYDEIIEKFRGR